MKIKSKEQIKNFPAEAGPTGCTRCFFSGTGFSREEASLVAINFAADRSHSMHAVPFSGTGFSREGAGLVAVNNGANASGQAPPNHSARHPPQSSANLSQDWQNPSLP
ncbi:hypothetical protein [Pseudomonas sp. W2-17]|uniref:hypothetical protein n=1 Tax=Pseudomonas sp. W2-17 TaxID=3058039 RepID=UPI0034E09484